MVSHFTASGYFSSTMRDDGRIYVVPEKSAEVEKILSTPLPFVGRPHNHEFFQRKYGIDPNHNKDTISCVRSSASTVFPVFFRQK